MKYDYLIVGAGLFGSVFAYEMGKKNKKCLVIDKRNHTGGNIYCENIENINVHKYGAHIFHTNNKKIWEYVNSFVEFNNFINSPLANFKDKLYNLPFNMNTFYQIWQTKSPKEAQEKIEQQIKEANIKNISNLEEQAISLIGNDIYKMFIKGYTEKQWGKKATELPAFIIKRIPVRFNYDNNYFNAKYQGIPIGSYNLLINKLLSKADILLNTNYFENQANFKNIAKKIIFTGMIDEFFDYEFGKLEYRSLKFENEILNIENFQGNAVINYTDFEVPYTRIIEHKHFENSISKKTIITKEYPINFEKGLEPYYPINDQINNKIYNKYLELAKKEKNIIFGGRLGEYKYYDMDGIIEKALNLSQNEI